MISPLSWKEVAREPLLLRYLRKPPGGGWSHACVVEGGRGERQEAWLLSALRLWFCEERGADPCGSCGPCRAIASRVFPGMTWVRPLPGKEIGIGEVRQVRELLSWKGISGEKRVVVVAGAEKLSAEAVQALLKLLEEPPPETYFFLSTSIPFALPPTIRSRCLSLNFSARPAWWRGREGGVISEAEAWSLTAPPEGGSPAEREWWGKLWEKRGSWLFLAGRAEKLPELVTEIDRVREAGGTLEPGAQVRMLLDFFLVLGRDLLWSRAGGNPEGLISRDLAREMGTLAPRWTAEKIARRLSRMLELRQALAGPASRELLLWRALFTMAEG